MSQPTGGLDTPSSLAPARPTGVRWRILGALLAVRSLLGVFTAPIYPASGLAVAHWFPARQRAGANGAIMAAALLGIASCYHVFGALLDRFDWPAAFVLAGAATVVLAVLWI